MSIAEMYESGIHKHNKGHFRNLLMLAQSDGVVTDEENDFLNKIGQKIGLSKEQIKNIKENPEQYPTFPPFGKEERIIRYINFIEVIKSDNVIDDREVSLLKKFGIAIGFNDTDSTELFNTINRLLDEKHTEDEILAQLY